MSGAETVLEWLAFLGRWAGGWMGGGSEATLWVRELLAEAGLRVLCSLGVFLVVAPLCALSRWWEGRHGGGARGASLRAALWCLVLLRLLLPADLAAPWSPGTLWQSWTAAPAPAEGFVDLHRGALPGASVGGVVPPPATGWLAGVLLAGFPWLLLAIWLCGSGAVAWLLARRRRRFVALARRSPAVTDPAVLERFRELRSVLGLDRPVRLVAGEAAVTPFTVGWLRPVIYLPAAVMEEPAERDAALAHELAHGARWDDLRLSALRLFQTVWFFHPLVWWVGVRLAEEREHLTDARVLASGALTPRSYGRGLLSAACRSLSGGAAVAALHHPQRRLSMRIRSIAQYRPPRLARPWIAVVVVLLAVAILPLAPTAEGGGEVPPVATPAPSYGGSGAGSQAWSAGAASGSGWAVGAGGSTAQGAAAAWRHPVAEARLTSGFGMRPHPLSGERLLHRGVDLAAPIGTPVRSPAEGVVAVATERWEGGERHGTVVIVDHGDGLRSFYSHLDALTVTAGQSVAAGQQVGTVGNTGDSTGPHLHFEVWQDGEPVNPSEWVSALR